MVAGGGRGGRGRREVGVEAGEQAAEEGPVGLGPAGEDGADHVAPLGEQLLERALPLREQLDLAGAAVLGVGGDADEPALLQVPDLPAHRGRVEAELLGQDRVPGGAALGERAQDREQGVVELVAGEPAPHPAGELEDRRHEDVLGRAVALPE